MAGRSKSAPTPLPNAMLMRPSPLTRMAIRQRGAAFPACAPLGRFAPLTPPPRPDAPRRLLSMAQTGDRKMTMPLHWHRRCLDNSRQHLAEKKKELERRAAEIKHLELKCDHYQEQIMTAISRNMDAFDSERF